MTLITPKQRSDIPEMEPMFQAVESAMGFVPESFLTMAHWPELLQGFSGLAGTVISGGELEGSLKQLIAFAVSNTAGCRYCQAHTSHNAAHHGVDEARLNAVFDFEHSDLFSAAEKAALSIALDAGTVPNGVTPAHMDELKRHFTDRQCVEIVAVIALFGFLNRWNDTMATTLEALPKAFAAGTFAGQGWSAGKHD